MKISKVVILGLVIAMACSNERETPKGYKFTLVSKGDGNKVEIGKFLVMDLLFKDEKDSVWYDNRKNEAPEIVMIRDTVGMASEEGLDEVFRMLSKGDSVVMGISTQTLFEKTWGQPVPPGVDPKGTLTFYLRVNDVVDSAGAMKLQQEIVARQNEKAQKEREEAFAKEREHAIVQIAKDTVEIDQYLKSKNIVARKTASGLRYVVTKPGRGSAAQTGQTVKINYAGYLLSGTFFDTSNEALAKEKGVHTPGRPYEPFELIAGQGGVIPGWEEAILLMNKGAKMTVYIPSTLAWGSRKRSDVIVENSIVVFDMEMVDIK
jgi:FKBP-type peptidyl-prolyl cis-trans isomerase FkpA